MTLTQTTIQGEVVTHQPAISFSISFQHPFNRAGGRTSNVGGITHHMEAVACSSSVTGAQKRRKWTLFVVGLAVCLLGVLFIWLGDGHDSVFRKALVVVGLILTIGGIGVLRYLLISSFRRKK